MPRNGNWTPNTVHKKSISDRLNLKDKIKNLLKDIEYFHLLDFNREMFHTTSKNSFKN